jgi:hypothetical protein
MVYYSAKRLRTRVLDQFALQKTTAEDIEDHVINDYIRLMKSYFSQKDKIPKSQLVEIRYEDFIADPLGLMQKIYTELGLPDFGRAKTAMKLHLEKQANYVKNIHKIDENTIRKIDEHWGFTIKRWGYELPNELEKNRLSAKF